MFKFVSVKRQRSIVFLGAVVVSLLCGQLGVYGETGASLVEGETAKDADLEGDEFANIAAPCQIFCTLEYLPVCGTDGKTYPNICHLNAYNKCHGTHIKKAHDGPCLPHGHCVPDPHPVICHCPCTILCTNIFKPVCGTDGKTYGNACQLARSTACIHPPVKVCHKGPCKYEHL